MFTTAPNSLVETGIDGLDAILLGGIPSTNVILVQGSTGSGKTLLGMEFIYRGITRFDEPGLIVVFETSPDKLVRDAAAFGWDFKQLQAQNKLQIVFTSPQVLDQEMRSPDSLLLETASEMGARRIFIDGIGLLSQLPHNASTSEANEAASFREILQQLIEGLNRENLTAMLSHECGKHHESLPAMEAAEFLADTVIHLQRSGHDRRMHRCIEIVKSRGQDFEAGEHTLRITGGKGLQVFRRVQAPLHGVSAQPTSVARRSLIGVDALDTLIGGGIFDGSTTMVVGVSGVGKTVLGTQILREGALKQGKRGLLISLDEHPAQIVRNAETLGLDLQAQIDSGTIHILFESPQELNIDAHFAKIISTIEEHGIQRMVIDGTTSYSTALRNQRVYRDFFHALVAYSKSRLMTTFFNYENPEFLGISSYMPDFPVSSIVDNIIVLSLVELGTTLRRCLTVVKARGSKHEFDSREYVIGQGGIALLPVAESAAAPSPLAGYSSVLSRAPTRFQRLDKKEAPKAKAASVR
ncbi:MAG: ATPase domain-containing protein [Bryobacteraceae bacterium]